ncbi:MAG: DUF4127 family protein [Selenomonadaceae bacterium]|nr:DUF4127 family protein [Selenomonadaceae bacterium]
MKQILMTVLALIFLTSTAFAQSKKILYVPMDDRPCNLYQVAQVAEKLGYELLTPPEGMIGTKGFNGDPDKMWIWLDENAPQAQAAVIATDSMIYGSLVGSRLHNLDAETILERAQRFKTFHEKFSYLPIYAFGTIMRTPRSASSSSAEPEYYKEYGAKFFNYTVLLDKQEMGKLSSGDKKKLKNLEAEIPKEYLDDWFKRRAKNSDANELFVEYTRAGIFEYFLLGCDDSAEFSQTHRESRRLTKLSSDLGKTVVQITSGADELGMLMISRAINRDRNEIPFVSVMYNAGKGAETFPTYCNEPLGVSIDAAIIAAGGLKIPAHERADLVLAVNTRENGKTFEAAVAKKNKLKQRADIKTFINPIKNFIKKGYPVAIADVSFSNGADNALMKQLQRNDLQYRIKAYGGWNTATNSSGFVIGAGVLTRFMNDKDIAELLTTRYLDEWAYQANVRQEIVGASYGLTGEGTPMDLKDKLQPLEQLLNEKMCDFAYKNLILPKNWRLENLQFNLPWKRTFECNSQFKLVD